jgi:hypothetical protein
MSFQDEFFKYNLLLPDKRFRGTPSSLFKLLGWSWISITSLNLDFFVMQPACINQSVPYATHFDPEEGSSMFFQNIGIRLKCHNQEDHSLISVAVSIG